MGQLVLEHNDFERTSIVIIYVAEKGSVEKSSPRDLLSRLSLQFFLLPSKMARPLKVKRYIFMVINLPGE